MKNIKYIIFTLLISFISIFHVNASCTDEEITSLKELANDIKITYKHLGKIEDEEGIYYNIFEVNIKNIDDDFYILYLNDTEKLVATDGKITKNFNNGTWKFNIYSNKCGIKITDIDVYIPRFNTYSLDPLCDGIDGNDFPLCGKYYEYDVSYDNFVDRVNSYRSIHDIDENINDEKKDEKNIFSLVYDSILNFFINYKLYIIISIAILLIVIVLFIIIRKRKKRGVLE